MASYSSRNYSSNELTSFSAFADRVAADNALYEQQLSSCFKVSVEGHHTSARGVASVYTMYFRSCGNIFDVVIPTDPASGLVERRGFIYFMDEASQEKALALDGSNVGFPFIGRYTEYSHVAATLGGWNVVVKALPRESCEFSPYELVETRRLRFSGYRTRGVIVSGYDTSQSADVIRSALLNLFRPCGEIVYLDVECNPDQPGHLHSVGCLCVNGDEARDKAIALDGTDMGGWNLAVRESGKTRRLAPPPKEASLLIF